MTYQDELFTFSNAKPKTQPLTAAKKTLSFNEQLISDYTAVRAGSGNLNSGDKWNFCLTSA